MIRPPGKFLQLGKCPVAGKRVKFLKVLGDYVTTQHSVDIRLLLSIYPKSPLRARPLRGFAIEARLGATRFGKSLNIRNKPNEIMGYEIAAC
jgi:hypothetical protein